MRYEVMRGIPHGFCTNGYLSKQNTAIELPQGEESWNLFPRKLWQREEEIIQLSLSPVYPVVERR